jgi:hypothetical protein
MSQTKAIATLFLLVCIAWLVPSNAISKAQTSVCKQVPADLSGTRNLTSAFRWINADDVTFVIDQGVQDFMGSLPIIYRYNARTDQLDRLPSIPPFSMNSLQNNALQTLAVTTELAPYIYVAPLGEQIIFPRQEGGQAVLWVKDIASQQEHNLGIRVIPSQIYDPNLYWDAAGERFLVASLLGSEGNILVSFGNNQITAQNLTDVLPWQHYGTPYEPFFVAGVSPSWRYILIRPLSINETLVYDNSTRQIFQLDLFIFSSGVVWANETQFRALSSNGTIVDYDLSTNTKETVLDLKSLSPDIALWSWQTQLSPNGMYASLQTPKGIFVCKLQE